jgi:hypothetical protein
MSSPTSPFMDHAAPVLSGDPTLSDDQRADLHDAFYQKDPAALTAHLQTLAIPDDTKHKLFQAKQASMPPTPPVDKVTDAVHRLAAIDPQTLEIAESHPNLLKAFTTAATTPEKEPTAAAGATSGADKGKKTSKAPTAPVAPRADGQPHFPAIPDGHHRVLSTNGGVYDVPHENIDAARVADPNLHILNP